MEVTSIPSTEPQEMDGEVQESAALLREGLASEFDDTTVRSSEVTFRPGERTKFHTHDGIQLLYVTEGTGVVGNREEERTVTEGDLILFPPGEEHWHGNRDDADSSFSHLFFIVERTGTTTTVAE
ncbi:cupin domain-containing protein [Natronorarus salvus]|uniref:cupin domain-containing protein n=1 Tax=Natronorarus salvus TaxID=3117733 RepID=UPI002F25FEF2